MIGNPALTPTDAATLLIDLRRITARVGPVCEFRDQRNHVFIREDQDIKLKINQHTSIHGLMVFCRSEIISSPL